VLLLYPCPGTVECLQHHAWNLKLSRSLKKQGCISDCRHLLVDFSVSRLLDPLAELLVTACSLCHHLHQLLRQILFLRQLTAEHPDELWVVEPLPDVLGDFGAWWSPALSLRLGNFVELWLLSTSQLAARRLGRPGHSRGSLSAGALASSLLWPILFLALPVFGGLQEEFMLFRPLLIVWEDIVRILESLFFGGLPSLFCPLQLLLGSKPL